MINNSVNSSNSPNTVVITDQNQNQVLVTQPTTTILEVGAIGPQGPVGPIGPIPTSGSFTGSFSGSFTGSLQGTASYALTASYLQGYVSPFPYSGSAVITGSLTVSGSSTFTNIGPAIFSGSVIGTDGFSGSFSGSGANLFDIPASGITGLNLSRIATGSVSASVSPGTASFAIVSGSSTFMFVSSSGNVGLGTTTPAYTADINGSTRIVNDLYLGTTSTTGANIIVNRSSVGSADLLAKFDFRRNSISLGYIEVGTNSSLLEYAFYANGQDHFRLTTSTALFGKSNGTSNIQVGIWATSNHLTLGAQTSAAANIDTIFQGGYGEIAKIRAIKGANLTPSGQLAFYTHNGTASSETMRIFSTGNIGINTTTDAGFKLDVNGNSRVKGAGATDSTNAFVVQNSAGSSALTIANGLTTIVHGDLQLVNTVLYWASASQIRNISNGVLRITNSSNSDFTRLQFGGGTTAFPSLQRNGSALAIMDATGTSLSNLLIGTTTDIASSKLTIESTTQGFLPPRTNLTSNISTPAQGLMTYLTGSTNEGLYYYSSGSIKSWTRLLNDTGSQSISGSLTITGSNPLLRLNGSGSELMSVDGASGRLFTVSDDLSNSLFSVNTIAGLPVIEAFATNDVFLGKYNTYPIKTVASGTLAVITGSISGSVAAPGSTTQIVYNNGGTLFATSSFVYSGSNVGIGTSTPISFFDVVSTSGFPKTFISFRRPTVGDWGLSLGSETISNLYIGAVDVPGTVTSRYFWRANYNTAGVAANTFRPIDAALTTVPVVEIQGVSSTSANYFSITSAGASMGDILGVKSTGNVLINSTTDAGYKLDVNGTARVSGDLTVSSNTITVGKGVSTGTFNTVLGTSPLGAAASSTSAYTVAIGRTAGYLCASGNHNVLIGTEVTQLAPSITLSTLIGNKIFGSVTSSISQVLAIGTGDTNNYYPTIYATNIYSNSPNVRIGNNGGALASVPSAIATSALLELSATTKGFLPPRTNLTSNISTPAQGLMTYVTASATEGLYYYNSGSSYQGWTRLLNDSGSQTITNGSLLVYAPSAGNGVTAYVGSAGMTITGNNGSGNPGISSTSGIIHISSTINGTGGSEVLNVNRSANGAYIQAWRSFAGTALSLVDSNGNFAIRRTTATASLDVAGTTRISGSFNTATSGSILTVIGSGSAQPIFTVQGSQGELFSITDSLSGSLFSVNDISGLPILEVFSDNTTLIGNYQDPMLITTAKVVQTNSGSFTVYSLPTASYDTAFFEYSVKSGSNARAGTIMAIQSGSSVNFTETTTTDFGDTTPVSFTVIVTGSNMALTGSSTTGSWTIKTIVRGL